MTAIESNYGTKKDLVRSLTYQSQYRIGLLGKYRKIEWRRVRRLVFVCKGNICRSPYAEVRARQFFENTTSFGLQAKSGESANSLAIQNAARRDLDLRDHHAISLHDVTLGSDDLLVGMEPAHVSALDAIVRRERLGSQVTLLGIWSDCLRPYLADPYNRSDSFFQTCYTCIDKNLHQIATNLRNPL